MSDKPENRVSIGRRGKRWVVRIRQAGAEQKRKFETEDFARNFAAGQALRLGVTVSDDETARASE